MTKGNKQPKIKMAK
jgi:hypothetical protein